LWTSTWYTHHNEEDEEMDKKWRRYGVWK
jgi:hypothetical protein